MSGRAVSEGGVPGFTGTHRLEIVVYRAPDGDDELTFFEDGRRVTPQAVGVTVVIVDPGRSGADAEWVEAMEWAAAASTPAAAKLITDLAYGEA